MSVRKAGGHGGGCLHGEKKLCPGSKDHEVNGWASAVMRTFL